MERKTGQRDIMRKEREREQGARAEKGGGEEAGSYVLPQKVPQTRGARGGDG